MKKDQFQIDVAQYVFDKLKENGSWISIYNLRHAAKKDLLNSLPNINYVELNGYIRRASEMLFDLGLINSSDNHITLKPDAFMMPDSTKIKDLIEQKNNNKQFDENKNKRNFYINIAGIIIIPSLTLLFNIFSKQGSFELIIAWILVGFAIGYFLNDIINKRL